MDSRTPIITVPPLSPVEDLYGEILAPGAVVGSYVVHGLAVEGGFAAVYRAHHMDTGKLVALKVLRRALAASPRMLARFQQEAEAVQRIDHPNIVEIYEFEMITPGRPYITMEWLEGRNLLEELRVRGSLSMREALDIMSQIGAGLAKAHAHGVVHRDLKANNIMMVPRGDWFLVKLIDFGIAKLVAPGDQHTTLTTRTIIGTPETMAPEQIRCQDIDARTDIYAVGLLLYQLVCGRLPFVGQSVIDIEQMHLYATPPRVSDMAPVSTAVDAVVARALQKRKEDRYGSITELIEALHQAVASESAQAPVHVRRHQPGIGVYIEVQTALPDTGNLGELDTLPRDDGEDAFVHEAIAERIDEVLEHVEELMISVGLSLGVFETSNAMLGVTLLPPGAAAHEARADLLHALLVRHRQWSARFGAGQQPLRIRVAVHAADVEVDMRGSERKVSGGELLELGRWPSCPSSHGVFASATVVADMAQRVQLVPVPDTTALYRIELSS
jgi:serine/threonine protein kinase